MRALARAVPHRWLGYLDYYLRPALRNSWGGPLNGQKARQQVVSQLLRRANVQAVIETGTFRGTSTEYFAAQAAVPVYTIESSPRYYHYSRLRFRSDSNVEVRLGYSPDVLRRLGADRTTPKTHVFFYLDAHWYRQLPLRQELEVIDQYWTDSVIMIDDFEVPDDPGYLFDDYGPGMRLGLGLLSSMPNFRKRVYFPATPAAEETGMKRGYVVLAEGAALDVLANVDGLRPYSLRHAS